MKLLYAIQGTGNGHIARAQELVPIFQQYADVDLLLSGTKCELDLPWQIKYRLKGLGFVYDEKGGVDIRKTIISESFVSFVKEVRKLPVNDYDLVISDFEPVSSWACKLKGKKCIGLSHQSAVLNNQVSINSKPDLLGISILKHYAPFSQSYGFHFKAIGDTVSTPVIRRDIREAKPSGKGHYTVYLPAYDDLRIISFLAKFPEIRWDVFSKHSRQPYSFQNIKIQPVNKPDFTKSIIASKGVFCNAGFETPAEALFLKKKLCVIPMKGQYEQTCNASMLKSMGVPVLHSINEESIGVFEDWLNSETIVEVSYPDKSLRIVERVLEEAGNCTIEYFPMEGAMLMPLR